MEIKSELKQPYTENERLDFIVEQNHKLGYEIRQVETTYEVEEEVPYTEIETEELQVPVLDEEGNPVLDEEGNPTFETQTIEKEVVKYRTETVEKTGCNLEAWGYTEEELAQKEQERLAMLNMTGADVERAIYKVKGIDFDDILAMVKANPAIDEKALKIEFKANNFFRGNPYIEQVGALLGFTSDMLDRFFDTKDYHELIAKEGENENTTDTTTDIQDELDTTTSKSDETDTDILE